MTRKRSWHYENDGPGRRILCEDRGPDYPPRRTVEVRCCGSWVHCDSDTYCERCGQEFNSSGQRLAPREFWGEETGERFA